MVIPSSWIVTNIYNTNSCVCMLVLSLIVLSLRCVKFFYLVHRFREFCECFVVFFDKHIFFMGQLSVFATSAVRRSLSSRSIPHSSSMCSAV